jgi:hypothetical protein
VAAPRIRELRRLLRYRSLVVSEAVRMKNKMAGLLMETGALYVKEKLHRRVPHTFAHSVCSPMTSFAKRPGTSFTLSRERSERGVSQGCRGRRWMFKSSA